MNTSEPAEQCKLVNKFGSFKIDIEISILQNIQQILKGNVPSRQFNISHNMTFWRVDILTASERKKTTK